MPETEFFTFVVYHTQISREGIERIGNIYEYDPAVKWKERWETFQQDFLPHADRYIDICFQSIKLVHKKCRCVVLTDQTTTLNLPDDIEIVRYALDSDKPAYMRLLAQTKFLNQADSGTHIVFLDYDMLVQQDLSQLCNEDFDVALTCEMHNHRIQGSFIMVRKNSLDKGMVFLKLLEEIFKNNFSTYDAWGGVEASMNSLGTISYPSSSEGVTTQIQDLKVRILPGEKYNYPFYPNDLILGVEYLPNKMILHFRGDIKSDMLDYWNDYLRPRQ